MLLIQIKLVVNVAMFLFCDMVCLLFYLRHLFCFRICIDAVYNASMRLTLLPGVPVWTNSPAHKICQNTQDLKSFHAAVTSAEKSAALGSAAAKKWLTVPCASLLCRYARLGVEWWNTRREKLNPSNVECTVEVSWL